MWSQESAAFQDLYTQRATGCLPKENTWPVVYQVTQLAVGKGPKQIMKDADLGWPWRKYSCMLFVYCCVNTIILNHFIIHLLQTPKIQVALGLC